MGLFNKNKEEKKGDIPRLPELPRLPDLPGLEDLKNLPQLPSFPRSSFGEKFSQNTIKDAIAGRKEVGENFDANDSDDEEESEMMPKLAKKDFMSKEMDSESEGGDEYRQFQKFERRVLEVPTISDSGNYKRTEPIFIRLDKFEESVKIFEKTRNQISEIESVLREIKGIKEQEEKELLFWEQEIQNIKKQIEKVDKDIFSRVENK